MSDSLDTALAEFSSREVVIAELASKYAGLTTDTKEGYEAVRVGIGELRNLRSEIEKRRVALKADALEWGRKVDGEAKRLTAAVLAIEEPLKLAKQVVDDEKERIRKEKEAAERAKAEAILQARIEAEQAKRQAAHEAEQERLRVEGEKLAAERAAMEAERKVIEEQRRAEQAKVDAERKEIEAARRAEQEKIAAERAAIEAERRAIEQERQKQERAEFERQAKVIAEQAAREKVELERIAAEQAAIAKAKADEEERQRLEAMRPDAEKLRAFASQIRCLDLPVIQSDGAQHALVVAGGMLTQAASGLDAWADSVEPAPAKKKRAKKQVMETAAN